VLAADGVVWIWPKNGADGYRIEPVGSECLCGLAITRGNVLSGLFGASILGAAAPGRSW